MAQLHWGRNGTTWHIREQGEELMLLAITTLGREQMLKHITWDPGVPVLRLLVCDASGELVDAEDWDRAVHGYDCHQTVPSGSRALFALVVPKFVPNADSIVASVELSPARSTAVNKSGGSSSFPYKFDVVEGERTSRGVSIANSPNAKMSILVSGFKPGERIASVRADVSGGKLEGVWANLGGDSTFYKAGRSNSADTQGAVVDSIQVDVRGTRGQRAHVERLEIVWGEEEQAEAAPAPKRRVKPLTPSSYAPTTGAPAVSVIIPAYNRAHCIFATIASVFAQTYQDFEVIVVDDASSDNTWGETFWFRENFPGRLRFIKLSHNQGESFARNVAFEKSRGRYIACIDSDDQWEPTYLEKMVAALEGRNADLVWSFVSFFTVTDDGTLKPEQYGWINIPDQIRNPNHNRIWIGPQHCIYRRQWFLGYDEDVDKGEDAEMYERMLAKGARFVCLPENLVRIIHHRDSQNRSGEWTKEDRWRLRLATRPQTVAAEYPARASMVSLTMLAWNRLHFVPGTLDNLRSTINQNETPYELIIIDNGSSDGTTQWLDDRYEELVLDGHKIIFNGWNAGIPNALNQGLLLKEGDVFLHAASDIHMEDGWLSRLLGSYNRYPNLAVSGVTYDGIPNDILRRDPDYPGLLFPPDDAAIGPAFSFPNDIFRRVGYFNVELGKYGREDTLYCRRARAAGYKVAYVDGTRCVHAGEHLSPKGKTAESEYKRRMLEVSKAYTLHYTDVLKTREESYIQRPVNPLFSLSPGATMAFSNQRILPSQVALCFTLRSSNLDMVKRAVDTCVSNTHLPVEIVFVCNNAPSKVVEWALLTRRALLERNTLAHVINFRGNWGIAKSYNAALACTWAPFLATLNDDIIASEGWLERLLEIAALPHVGYVCSNTSQHRAYLSGDYSIRRPEDIPLGSETSAPVDPNRFVGFASVVQRNKLCDVGPFDTSTFVYHGETELAARLGEAGYAPYQKLNSRVLHLRAGSTQYAERSLRHLADQYLPESLRRLR